MIAVVHITGTIPYRADGSQAESVLDAANRIFETNEGLGQRARHSQHAALVKSNQARASTARPALPPPGGEPSATIYYLFDQPEYLAQRLGQDVASVVTNSAADASAAYQATARRGQTVLGPERRISIYA